MSEPPCTCAVCTCADAAPMVLLQGLLAAAAHAGVLVEGWLGWFLPGTASLAAVLVARNWSRPR